jgi:hypothetical protein
VNNTSKVSEVQDRGGLALMGICTRVMILLFYLSSIVSMFSDPLSVPVDFRVIYIIIMYALILLGFALFVLSFLGDILRYLRDKRS